MYKHIGKIELGNTVDITDPCYDKGTWCRMTTECQPGLYTGIANVIDEGVWGERVAQLFIFKDGIETGFSEIIGCIGVDAGLAGFFNNKPDYKGDAWMDFLVEANVFKTKDKYNYDDNYYITKNGIFSKSGYGDGS